MALALCRWAEDHYACIARWDYAGAARASRKHQWRIALWAAAVHLLGDP